ncbi:Uncharacterized protein APZ42_023213 [Daphnia magna]|uniref:Uncharacterized protein n=1 Tax=Daphnia magna TaxID=35525 RepID=A0A162DHW2_9CRUS|nr:Uncharacterized protein APZ42_023213 [Daphnia magna]
MPTNKCALFHARHSSRSRLATLTFVTGETLAPFYRVTKYKKNFLIFRLACMGAVYVERPYSILISTGNNTSDNK